NLNCYTFVPKRIYAIIYIYLYQLMSVNVTYQYKISRNLIHFPFHRRGYKMDSGKGLIDIGSTYLPALNWGNDSSLLRNIAIIGSAVGVAGGLGFLCGRYFHINDNSSHTLDLLSRLLNDGTTFFILLLLPYVYVVYIYNILILTYILTLFKEVNFPPNPV